MSTINSGLSIYPSGYDLNASGSTMAFVYDETRDPYTGNVTSSGSQIVGLQVNTGYTAINNIEQTLGINPQGNYSTVGARILAFESVSGSSAFVKRVGDSMSGNLSMISGASISVGQLISASGLGWSGAGAFTITTTGPLTINTQSSVLASSGSTTINTGQLLNINAGSGLGTIISISSGSTIFYQNILPSGSINIGASGNPINTLYVNNISGANLNSLIASGTFLSTSGGTLSGNTTLDGASILTTISGTGSIGSLSSPFLDMYAKTGYFTNISGMSPINFKSELVLSSGITPQTSGTLGLGSSNYPFAAVVSNSVTTNDVIISGISFNPSSLIQASGGAITGNLALISGATIVNAISGVNDLGSQSFPFANIWAGAVNGKASVKFKFNEILNPTVGASGAGMSYTFSQSPSGASVVWYSGGGFPPINVSLVPNAHYTISGNTLFLTPTVPASGSVFSPFYIY